MGARHNGKDGELYGMGVVMLIRKIMTVFSTTVALSLALNATPAKAEVTIDAVADRAQAVTNETITYTVTATQTTQGQTATADDLVGAQLAAPVKIENGLTFISDVGSFNDVLYIVGDFEDKPAYQTVDLSNGTPVGGAMQILPALDPFSSQGEINKARLINGNVIFVGESDSVADQNNEGTTWDLAGVPTGTGQINDHSSSGLFDAVSSGIVSGHGNDDSPVVGKVGGPLQLLPKTDLFGFALSISENGEWIVGSDGFVPGVWHSTSPELLDHQLQSLTYQPTADGNVPDFFRKAYVDSQFGPEGVAHYFDSVVTFSESLAIYNLTDGSLKADLGVGDFRDAVIYDNHNFIAVNTPDGGYLITREEPNARLDLTALIPPSLNLTNVGFVQGGFQIENDQVSMVVEGTGISGQEFYVLTFAYNSVTAAPAGQASVQNGTFRIDWDGNGTVDQTIVGNSGLTVTHFFTAAGNFNTRVTVEASNGEQSAVDTVTVSVTQTVVQSGVLRVGGTAGEDQVTLVDKGRKGIQVTIGGTSQTISGASIVQLFLGNGNDQLNANLGGHTIVIDAGDGNDRIQVRGEHSTVYGGNGNDTIVASGSRAVLLGGTGNDEFNLGAKRNIAVGGDGADTFTNGNGSTLIIAKNATLSSSDTTSIFNTIVLRNPQSALTAILTGKVFAETTPATDRLTVNGRPWAVVGSEDVVVGRVQRLNL